MTTIHPILQKLLAGAAPALLQRAGVSIPGDLPPEKMEEAIGQILGGGGAKPQGENLLLVYYRVRSDVSDREFRNLVERVFADREFEEIAQALLAAMQVIVRRQVNPG